MLRQVTDPAQAGRQAACYNVRRAKLRLQLLCWRYRRIASGSPAGTVLRILKDATYEQCIVLDTDYYEVNWRCVGSVALR